MTRYIYDATGTVLIGTEEAEPDCGLDFCERCGDCLDCYGGDECLESKDGQHLWVRYLETQ